MLHFHYHILDVNESGDAVSLQPEQVEIDLDASETPAPEAEKKAKKPRASSKTRKPRATKAKKKKLGYNESVDHTDMISTKNRVVTVVLKNGKSKVIYKDGQFTI